MFFLPIRRSFVLFSAIIFLGFSLMPFIIQVHFCHLDPQLNILLILPKQLRTKSLDL